MAPTPSSKPNPNQMRTPQSKHRLNFAGTAARNPHPSPNPNSALKENNPAEHPVEVVGRIRNLPDQKEKIVSFLHINPDQKTLRVRADVGCRDFTLDGISSSEEEDLEGFYKKFIESRIQGVKLGAKCTIMMYGPTGSGKSHTMFGSSKQPGIVYRSLRDILGNREEEGKGNSEVSSIGTFVQVTVLEIYNEEIYDLLSSNGGSGFGIGWPKGGSGSKVKLEVMGKKAKNATFIFGTEAGKIAKEIQKVEKRRIVKSTLCNDRSSRSHCMIILDVPTVGGRLMLVDMAGSENIDQAGQVGFEAKMQTAKINQGNIALKRVVESIANGDSHVPFRDSKLTMLLQDSFEDDKSKILMILCASPDPKELHKTLCTLEYGAKAKCIVRGALTPVKENNGTGDPSSTLILGSRIAAMDDFIYKLQMENKMKEKERNEAHKQLMKKEEEVAALRELLEEKGSGASEEEINQKVSKQTEMLKLELEKKLDECKRMAEEFVELERRRMEERILQQQEEVEMLRRRLQEIEFELQHSKNGSEKKNEGEDLEGVSFAKRLIGVYGDDGMVKSMSLDMSDQEPLVRDLKVIDGAVNHSNTSGIQGFLSTVYEEEEEEEENEEDEVEKVIVEEKIYSPQKLESTAKDVVSSRQVRIQNIFTLCGNYRELSQQHMKTPAPTTTSEDSLPDSFNKQNLPMHKFLHAADTEKSPGATKNISAPKENQSPLSPLENKMSLNKGVEFSKQGDVLSPSLVAPHLSSTPFLALART